MPGRGGAVGTMTLAVMTRASLGHTGHALIASRATQAIYAAVLLAAVIRIAASARTGVPDSAFGHGRDPVGVRISRFRCRIRADLDREPSCKVTSCAAPNPQIRSPAAEIPSEEHFHLRALNAETRANSFCLDYQQVQNRLRRRRKLLPICHLTIGTISAAHCLSALQDFFGVVTFRAGGPWLIRRRRDRARLSAVSRR